MEGKNGSLLPVVFYGTLLQGLPAKPGRPPFEELGHYVGPCEIRGLLYDWGPYPRLVAGEGRVRGELWQPQHPEALAMLDDWESCDPADTAGSVCVRQIATLIQPARRAWVYVYPPSAGLPLIESGDWSALPKAHDLAALLKLARDA